MSSSVTLLLALLLVGVQAGPLTNSPRQCSRECSISQSNAKYQYAPSKTYTYDFSGKSRIQMEGVSGATGDMDWDATVDLTWITPCDVSISIKNPSIAGQASKEVVERLTRYPLVVAMVDGSVKDVCAHPEDAPASINLKKGVASALQNSLPSLSPLSNTKTIDEVDVSGHCPTRYTVKQTDGSSSASILKFKDYKRCHERYASPNEGAAGSFFTKTPLPLEESYSECRQEIKNNIVESVTCEDQNIVKPAPGAYKYVVAKQTSQLKLKGQSSSSSSGMPLQKVKRTTLMYDFAPEPKTQEVMQQIQQQLKAVCQKIQGKVEKDAAEIMSQAIHLLRRAPDQEIERLYNEIKSGSFCQSPRMKGLFLDAIAYIGDSASAKIMTSALMEKSTTGGRQGLYIASLHLIERPTMQTVKNVMPLLESKNAPASAALAAGAIVHKYCRHHRRCQEEEPLRQLYEKLAQQVPSACRSSSSSQEQKQEALQILKTVGNMGNMSRPLERSILECVESKQAATPVRIAAAQALRQAKCQPEATSKLVQKAVQRDENTEVRIAAYLSAIRCASPQNVSAIVGNITGEANTQVRGFILSHLHNLKASLAPHHRRQAALLAGYSLPTNYSSDPTRHSHNLDLSYYAESIGLGAGIDTNLIYAPGQWTPKSLSANITANILESVINFAEVGIRFEKLDQLMERLFGPEGYFTGKSLREIKNDMSRFVEELVEYFSQNEGKSFGQGSRQSQLFKLIEQISESGLPVADIFARMFGQELAFKSMSGKLNKVDIDEITKILLKYFEEFAMELHGLNVNTARMAHAQVEFKLPSIAGIPLKMELETTAVLAIKAHSTLDLIKVFMELADSTGKLQLAPGLSVKAKAFVGFDLLAELGIESRNALRYADDINLTLESSAQSKEIALKYEIPEQSPSIEVSSATTMVLKPNKQQQQQHKQLYPSPSERSGSQSKACSNKLSALLGMELCWNIQMQEVTAMGKFPFIPPVTVQAYAKRASPSVKTIEVRGKWQKSQQGQKSIDLVLEVPGSQSPKKAEAYLAMTSPITSGAPVSAEVYGKIQSISSPGQYHSGALRAEYRRMNNRFGQKHQVAVYAGQDKVVSTSSKVLEAHAGGKWEEPTASVDFALRTYGSLAEHIQVDIELDADMGIERVRRHVYVPQSLSIHKCEARVETRQLKAEANIRPSGSGSASALLDVNYKAQNLLQVRGQGQLQGALRQRNFQAEAHASVQVKQSHYSASGAVRTSPQQYLVEAQVSSESQGRKVFETRAEYTVSGASHEATAQLSIPSYISPLSADIKAHEASRNNYQVSGVIKRGGSKFVEVEGPLALKWTEENKKVKAKFQVQSYYQGHSSYTAELQAASTPSRKALAVALEEGQQKLVDVDLEYDSSSGKRAHGQVSLNLPSVAVGSASAKLQSQQFQANANIKCRPQSPSARRVKVSANVNGASKTINAQVAWDADRDQSKMAAADLSYEFSREQGIAKARGSLTWKQAHYKVNTEGVYQRESQSGPAGTYGLMLDFNTPSGKEFSSQSRIVINQSGNRYSAHPVFSLRTLSGKTAEVQGTVNYEKMSGKYSFQADGDLSVASTWNEKLILQASARNQNSQSSTEASLKVKGSGPALRQPFESEFEAQLHSNSATVRAQVKRGSETVAQITGSGHYEYSSGRLQSFGSQVDIKLPQTQTKEIAATAKMTRPGQITAEVTKQNEVVGRVTVTYGDAGKCTIVVQRQQKETEIALQSEQSGLRLEIYPNKKSNEGKYQIRSSYRLNQYGLPTQAEIKLTAPNSAKEMKVYYDIQTSGDRVKAEAVADIFKSSEKKLIASVEATKVSEAKYQVQMQLAAPQYKAQSKFALETSLASSYARFGIKYQGSGSEQDCSIVYSKLPSGGATLALNIKNGVQLTTSLEHVDHSGCYGWKLYTSAKSQSYGSYAISSTACRPGYIEIASKAEGSNTKYVLKAGMQGYRKAELGLVAVKQSYKQLKHASATYTQNAPVVQGEAKPIALLSFNLPSSMVLSMHASYDAQEARAAQRSASEGKIRQLRQDAAEKCRELKQKLSEVFENCRFADLPEPIQRIIDDIIHIVKEWYHDLLNSSLVAELKELYQKARAYAREIVQWIHNHFKTAKEQARRLRKELAQACEDAKQYLEENHRETYETIKRKSEQIKELASSPAKINQYYEKCREYIRESRPAKYLRQKVNEVKAKYPEQWQVMRQIASQVYEQLEKDAARAKSYFMRFGTFRRAAEIYNAEQSGKRMSELASAIQRNFLFSIRSEKGYINIFAPLAQPSYSVPSAVASIGVPRSPLRSYRAASASYNSYLSGNFMRNYLPPHSHVAVLTGSSLTTFNGATIHMKPSTCTYKLAASQDTQIYVTRDGLHNAKAECHCGETEVIIRPDEGQVQVRQRGSTQELSHGKHQFGKVTVQVGEKKLNVSTPSMSLLCERGHNYMLVEAKPWSHGKIRGLAGANNQEQASDLMTQENKMATAGNYARRISEESSQQLANSWAQKGSCQKTSSPNFGSFYSEASRADPKQACADKVKMIAKECESTIKSFQYLEMCKETTSACQIPKAYKAYCESKGVHCPDIGC